ncbi:MAG: hypothetical protein GY868_05680 [Deltaproteobacteria bacterium]|nr:hypothetical protein [Deltaproteobacteria bacterium]
MRYVIFSLPFYLRSPQTTDFRVVALFLAQVRRLLYPQVCVFDSDTGEYLAVYLKR